MRSTALLLGWSLAAPFAWIAAADGPTGAMYLTSGARETKQFLRLRGDQVVAAWHGVGQYEDLLAINDTIRTGTAGHSGEPSAEYRLDGTDTGVRFSRSTPIAAMWDGTTDGQHNYAVVVPNGAVWRFDPDWTNGQFIFGTATDARGITFDPTDGTLWLAASRPARLLHRTMSGEPLSDTPLPISADLVGIGLDHRDGTLWISTYTYESPMYQVSKQGQILQTFTLPQPGTHVFGVEFRLPPACAADMDRSGTLTLADFSTFRNAYAAGDLVADLNDDDALTLADFAEFRNAYTAGCP